MAKYGFSFLFLLCVTGLFAQATIRPPKVAGFIYTQEKGVNFSLNTSGLSFGFSKGRLKNYKFTPFWQFELGTLKHPKEYKQSTALHTTRNSRPYYYGKKNVFLTARILRGRKNYLSEKAKTKGVAMGWQYMYGLSLGLLKPYYLNLEKQANPNLPGDIKAEKYSEDNRDAFLDFSTIMGAASFWKGIGETKIIPGFHARIGVLFDWGAFDAISKSIDAGVQLDVYPKKIPIMIEANNYPYFLNLYINFQFGKRS